MKQTLKLLATYHVKRGIFVQFALNFISETKAKVVGNLTSLTFEGGTEENWSDVTHKVLAARILEALMRFDSLNE